MAFRQDSRKSLLSLGQGPYEQDAGGYFHREGLASGPNAIASNKKEKMYLPTTTWTWAFMIAATLQAAAVLAIES